MFKVFSFCDEFIKVVTDIDLVEKFRLDEFYPIQQFTEIHDQNGNDIFEGDIISVPDDYDTYGFNAGEKYEIFFNSGGFRCKPKINPKAKGIWLEDEGEFLIVGNIHENPELLNQ